MFPLQKGSLNRSHKFVVSWVTPSGMCYFEGAKDIRSARSKKRHLKTWYKQNHLDKVRVKIWTTSLFTYDKLQFWAKCKDMENVLEREMVEV